MANIVEQTPNTADKAISLLNRGQLEEKAIKKVDYSIVRGKSSLVSPSEEQFETLQHRLKELIEEGHGETIYDVGIGDDGSGLTNDEFEASVATLHSLAATQDADCVLLRERVEGGTSTAQYLVRKRLESQDFLEIRVAVVGNVDAGKSTLLGVLTHGELDNGRGHARLKLFRHKHEMESGRTSSVGNDILGFDSTGEVVNRPEHGSLDWVKICEKSTKVITFIDLAGHERYLKTTVFGMTGHMPDFGMLMIGANAGIIGMTKEHLGLALALSVPVFVVVTKIDMCPPNILQDTLRLLVRILKSPGCRKVPVMVKTKDDVIVSATNFVSQRLCPIFQVSNVNGENLDLLKMFLNLLTTRVMSTDNDPAEFQIDDTYSVPGVGTVVSGTTLCGTIRLNDTLMLGPDPVGQFVAITVKSIHRKRMVVREVKAGQTASFALKKIKRSQIRKGMVMVSPSLNPSATWEFDGEILVLHHPTTISSRYQAMVHCGSIRQTASILSMSEECLRTGDKAKVRFRFIKYPEYLRPGQRLVFREGRTKAVGNVLAVPPPTGQIGVRLSQKPQKSNPQAQGQNVGENENQPAQKSRRRGGQKPLAEQNTRTIAKFMKNVASCMLIIIATCVVGGESILCDTCTCKNSIINCTENGLIDILDLWDHTEVVKDATLMHFDHNGIVHVKQLPPSKVRYLSLRQNKINKIDEMAFINLKLLLELDLSYNSLTAESLNPDIFKINIEDTSRPGSLIHLRLDYNNIHSLLPHTFKELSNLVSLTLAGNPLTVIDRPTSFALSSLPMLKVLNLSNTSLHELPNHLLHTPRFLEILNLSNNEFTQIPQGLDEAHALQRLDFSSNPIKSILGFPKMASLKVLHLSHMPELNIIGPRALSLLNVLEEFHCTHNNKLKSIDPTAFSYKLNDGSEGELWPRIVKLDLSYNALGYLDSRLLNRWDTLEELNLQGNKWICDCVNQWLVSTLAPMAESRHPEFLNDFTCQEPIEMSGISILDLDHRHYHMRCLDFYNNRPERDGILLIGILIGVILTVPFTMGIMMCCAKRKNSLSYYHRIFNQNKPYAHDYQLRETSIYQPTSIITDGY